MNKYYFRVKPLVWQGNISGDYRIFALSEKEYLPQIRRLKYVPTYEQIGEQTTFETARSICEEHNKNSVLEKIQVFQYAQTDIEYMGGSLDGEPLEEWEKLTERDL